MMSTLIVFSSFQRDDASVLKYDKISTNYLRLDVYKGTKIVYSYYKDLHSKLKSEDIKRGFLRLKDDMGLK